MSACVSCVHRRYVNFSGRCTRLTALNKLLGGADFFEKSHPSSAFRQLQLFRAGNGADCKHGPFRMQAVIVNLSTAGTYV